MSSTLTNDFKFLESVASSAPKVFCVNNNLEAAACSEALYVMPSRNKLNHFTPLKYYCFVHIHRRT